MSIPAMALLSFIFLVDFVLWVVDKLGSHVGNSLGRPGARTRLHGGLSWGVLSFRQGSNTADLRSL